MDVVVGRGDVAPSRIKFAREITPEPEPLVLPVPGTGNRPFQPSRSGVSPVTWRAMLPSTSPQIRLWVGTIQYIARSKKSLQLSAWAILKLPLYAAVPGSWTTERTA